MGNSDFEDFVQRYDADEVEEQEDDDDELEEQLEEDEAEEEEEEKEHELYLFALRLVSRFKGNFPLLKLMGWDLFDEIVELDLAEQFEVTLEAGEADDEHVADVGVIDCVNAEAKEGLDNKVVATPPFNWCKCIVLVLLLLMLMLLLLLLRPLFNTPFCCCARKYVAVVVSIVIGVTQIVLFKKLKPVCRPGVAVIVMLLPLQLPVVVVVIVSIFLVSAVVKSVVVTLLLLLLLWQAVSIVLVDKLLVACGWNQLGKLPFSVSIRSWSSVKRHDTGPSTPCVDSANKQEKQTIKT